MQYSQDVYIPPSRIENKPSKSVLLIYTGGTFGMILSTNGSLTPNSSLFNFWMEKIPEFTQADFPKLIFELTKESRDSTDIGPSEWIEMGSLIEKHYNSVDGIVVIHGTDTMSWSASALSFMLHNLGKPVVFTGSQIPLSVLRSDAKSNLLDSILVAANSEIPEVVVVFNGSILRGNRSVKRSSWEFNAFTSFNYPCLGVAGIHLTVDKERIRPKPTQPFCFLPYLSEKVVLFRLFPNETAAEMFKVVVENKTDIRGIVLEAFGVGNIPAWPKFLQTINEIGRRQQIFILVVSLCVRGSVMLDIYQNGLLLKNAGAVSGLDMTPEAAYCKLSFLIGLLDHEMQSEGNTSENDQVRYLDRERILALLKADLRGELTPEHLPDSTNNQELVI